MLRPRRGLGVAGIAGAAGGPRGHGAVDRGQHRAGRRAAAAEVDQLEAVAALARKRDELIGRAVVRRVPEGVLIAHRVRVAECEKASRHGAT